MTYRCFNVEIADNIAQVQLKRGDELNTMVPEFWSELPQIVRDIDDNAKARVIVISSTGPHFSGGLDVSAFAGGGAAPSESEALRRKRQRGAQFYDNVLHMQQSFSLLE